MATTSAESAGSTPAGAPRERDAARLIGCALALPVVVLVVRVLVSHWLSFSDWGVIELRVRDVGTSRTPIVGPYSRYGWSHPGPFLFYVLAVTYHVAAGHAKGLLLGALTINTSALAAIVWVGWKRGRLVGALVVSFFTLVLVRALGASFLVDPWNPRIVVLPLLAVFALSWLAVDEPRVALSLAVVFGSFAVQSHVGVAIPVVALLVTALAFLFVDNRNNDNRQSLNKSMLLTLAVGAILWLPVIVNELQPGGRNLGRVVSFFSHRYQNTTGPAQGIRFVDAQLTLPAPWITGHQAHDPVTQAITPANHFPFLLVLLVFAAIVSARRHDRESFRLCAFALTLVGAAYLAASRLIDTPYAYLLQWLWVVGTVAAFAATYTAMRACLANGGMRRAIEVAASVGVAALLVATTVASVRDRLVDEGGNERSIAAVAPPARALLRTLPQPILIVNPADDRESEVFASGLLVLAVREGVDARLTHSIGYIVGLEHSIRPGQEATRVVAAVGAAAEPYRHDPNYRLAVESKADASTPPFDIFVPAAG